MNGRYPLTRFPIVCFRFLTHAYKTWKLRRNNDIVIVNVVSTKMWFRPVCKCSACPLKLTPDVALYLLTSPQKGGQSSLLYQEHFSHRFFSMKSTPMFLDLSWIDQNRVIKSQWPLCVNVTKNSRRKYPKKPIRNSHGPCYKVVCKPPKKRTITISEIYFKDQESWRKNFVWSHF